MFLRRKQQRPRGKALDAHWVVASKATVLLERSGTFESFSAPPHQLNLEGNPGRCNDYRKAAHGPIDYGQWHGCDIVHSRQSGGVLHHRAVTTRASCLRTGQLSATSKSTRCTTHGTCGFPASCPMSLASAAPSISVVEEGCER